VTKLAFLPLNRVMIFHGLTYHPIQQAQIMYLFYPFYPDHERIINLVVTHRETRNRLKELRNIGRQYLLKELELSRLEDKLRLQLIQSSRKKKQDSVSQLEEKIQIIRHHELPVMDFYRTEMRQKTAYIRQLEKEIRQLLAGYSFRHSN
jgi:hypothetical protein